MIPLFKIFEWDNAKGLEFYNKHPNLTAGKTYNLWRKLMINGFNNEIKIYEQLKVLGFTVIPKTGEYWGWITAIENYEDKLAAMQYDFDIVDKEGNLFKVDAKTMHNGIISTIKNKYGDSGNKAFLTKWVFHGADYLIAIDDENRLWAATIDDYCGNNTFGSAQFEPHLLKCYRGN